MVKTALDTADHLEKSGISSQVLNMHTIKPLDKNNLNKAIKGKKMVVTIEEHNVIGGLGSAISEVLSENDNMPKKISFGIKSSKYDQ